MLKAVIFDMDGTICDTLPLCITAFKKAIEPLAGKNLSDEEIIATFGPSEEGTIHALLPHSYDQGLADYLQHYRLLHEMCPTPFDGIVDIIRFLKANHVIVALVTGKGRKSCDISLSYFGIADCFDMIETGSPEGQRKTEGMQDVLKQFGLMPREAVYVGDAVSDIHCARRAGMPIVAAAWASTAEPDELQKLHPDKLFDSVHQFKSYLETIIR